jgi:cyclopropane-fatty-acyl-phospholipid synthase
MKHTFIADAATIRKLPNIPATFRIAGMALLSAKTGKVTFTLPDGRQVVFDKRDGGPQADITVHDYAFAKRSIAGGDVGFAESYMDEQWSTPDLTAVLRYFGDNFDAVGDGDLARGKKTVRFMNMIRHFLNRNSKAGAKRNIYSHYDLGNAFYGMWLDPSMTYSSAIYSDPEASLEAAQFAKYEGICSILKPNSNSRLLEIGCGWGGFAEHVAKNYGSHITCLTISPSQREFAIKRITDAGLTGKVDIRLQDYRDHHGEYDGVASIEMFEAVGEAYWPSYFAKISEVLKPGAKAALQIITIADDLFQSYRKRADFIQHYIFPGGMLPSEIALKDQLRTANLSYDSENYFGHDYSRTLREWSESFNSKWADIELMNFDEHFRRMWNFYLSYCEAGFDSGRINVGQFAISKPASL